MSAENSARTLRLALLGHGRMGRTIEDLAPQRGFEIGPILTSATNPAGAGITPEKFQNVDVIVDFTSPAHVVANIRKAAALGQPIVVGTTGWNAHLDEVKEIVTRSGTALVYGANFSLGVQIFSQLVRAAAQKFSSLPLFSPYLVESHHRFKKDAPSGTALELARQVQPHLGGATLAISSVRGGYIPGTHEFGWDAEAETVELRHIARTRQAFAEGALYAARWVVGKKGVFHFSEILES
ncbi:MAG: dihydrodipicolinate reductase C-terminal domain-containing protein [Candidatus Acidiferrales bacterium]